MLIILYDRLRAIAQLRTLHLHIDSHLQRTKMAGIHFRELLVILVIISQTNARSRSKSDHQTGKCPTKCFLDQSTTRLWKEVDGTHVEESYIENCETDCSDMCLQSQDPRNTQRIAYMCGSRSEICNYEQNSACRKHTLEIDINKALPWPYHDGVIAEESFPAPSKFNDERCPVCMKPDLSRLDCMQDVGRTEKCVDEDSCWVFPLRDTIIVPIKEGIQVEFDKIIKCYQDSLLQTGEGCKHEKCTGDVYRADEDSGTMFSTQVTTMRPRTRESHSSTEYPTTEDDGIVTKRPTSTNKKEVQTAEAIKTSEHAMQKIGDDDTDLMVTPQPEHKRVCNDQDQDCPQKEKCIGKKMKDGMAEYQCTASKSPECTRDSGCIGTCMPPLSTCLSTPATPTHRPTVTGARQPTNSTDYVVKPKEPQHVVDQNVVEPTSSATALRISALLYLVQSISSGLLH